MDLYLRTEFEYLFKLECEIMTVQKTFGKFINVSVKIEGPKLFKKPLILKLKQTNYSMEV